ncbi:MAG: hypothetical protein ABSG21_12775 [Spirochaetia bacterium]
MTQACMTGARFAPLAVLILAFSGCPLTSDTPLSDPASARPDSRLLGTWRTQDKDSGEWHTLTILSFNEHEMLGIVPDETSGKLDAFRLFPTAIGAESFLSFRQLGEEAAGGAAEPWYFARYRIAEDRLRLSIVDDGLFEHKQFGSPGELQEFIRQHLTDPLLYSADADQQADLVWERTPARTGTLK